MTDTPTPENCITSLTLRGYRSIHDATLALRPLTILIGPNGSGKSNLVGFFRMLSHMMTREPHLQEYIGRTGGASSLLTDGPKHTREIEAALTLRTRAGINEYAFRLTHAAPDRLIFTEERFRFRAGDRLDEERDWYQVDVAGQGEPRLQREGEERSQSARVIHALLGRCKVFQFHDTSAYARIRQKGPVDDNHYLREDGANLAAFLLRLREDHPAEYRRITETVQQIVPFFRGFELVPDRSGQVLFQWSEQGTDGIFGAHQASDGMLRAVALIALLCQPDELLPNVVIIDEPELGLHPQALHQIAELAIETSGRCQILLATQSPALLDTVDPEDVLVVERDGRHSRFTRHAERELDDWLDAFSGEEG